MTEMLSISISKPIGSMAMGEQNDRQIDIDHSKAVKVRYDVECQRVSELAAMLESAISQFDKLAEDMIEQSKGEFGKLAVDIAERILAQKISSDDYDIEKIVAEAIKASPDKKDIEVYLNPADAKKFEMVLNQNPQGPLRLLKIVNDEGIGKAQCRLAGSKGIVDRLIDEQLEKISEALEKVN